MTIEKKLSPLRLTLTVLLLVSLAYPLFFAYIDRQFVLAQLASAWLLGALRLAGMALLIHGLMRLHTFIFRDRLPLLRYLAEGSLVLVATYWFLYLFAQFIDVPLGGSLPPDPGSWTFRRYIGLYLLGSVFIYLFLLGLNLYQAARQKEAQAARLQQEFAQVRLQALRSQVNPHFLFNSLSVLSSLVQVDAELSERFIQQLARAYRYILEQKEAELVSLQEELGFLDAYFFLLQIRFAKKVRLEKEIIAGAERLLLPPLTLQLLVENAVKHNRMSVQEPLVIVVRAVADRLVVENNLQPREKAESSTGVGLQNILNRYAMLSAKKPLLTKTTDTFRVELPLLNPPS